jgi:hypothetical protein
MIGIFATVESESRDAARQFDGSRASTLPAPFYR